MDTIPIKSAREEDLQVIGSDSYNLTKLYHQEVAIPEGIFVLPPNIQLKVILKHFNLRNREVFEQSLEVVRGEVYKIPVPEELGRILKSRKLDPKLVWRELLGRWVEKIRGNVWNLGVNQEVTSDLLAQPVFFTDSIKSSGEGYFNFGENDTRIKIYKGKLDPLQLKELHELIIKANKKLFIPHIYHWILEDKRGAKIKIVRVLPYTEDLENDKDKQVKESLASPLGGKKKEGKVVSKIFIDLEGLVIDEGVDGAMVVAEKSKNKEDFLFRVIEGALTLKDKPLIVKFSDRFDEANKTFAGVRGALRLLYDKALFGEEVGAVIFGRQKKQLLNINVCIPFTRSVNEFLEIKRELASFNLTRKGSFKIYLEAAVPENIINIEDYIQSGIDGVIINLDELISFIFGFDPKIEEGSIYKKEAKSVCKFLEGAIKRMHQENIPVLVAGELVLKEELMEFFIKNGVTGFIVKNSHLEVSKEVISFFEKRLVKKIN